MKTIHCLLTGLLMLSATVGSAQSRFSVSITAAPTYTYFNSHVTLLLPDGNGQVVPMEFFAKNSSYGYVTGMMAHYQFTPNWSVSTGFWHNRSGANGTFPFTPGNLPARIILSDSSVPLTVNYRPTTRRLSPYFSIGALGSFRGSTLYKPTDAGGFSDTKVTVGHHFLTVKALLGAGVVYKINSHLSLIAQPMLIWNFKPKGDFSHYVSYQINGQTQLVYSFWVRYIDEQIELS